MSPSPQQNQPPPRTTLEASREPSRLARSAARAGKLLIGMVHLPPLPGSPGARGRPAAAAIADALESARRDAAALLDEGMDGFILENFGDAPFHPEAVPAAVTAILSAIAVQVAGEARARFQPRTGEGPYLGINVLRNDAEAALAVATAADLQAIRVNVHCGVFAADQGLLEGRAHRTLRSRQLLDSTVEILADILVKHAAPIGSGEIDPAALARDTAYRGLADGLIVTGPATGASADLALLKTVRQAVPDRPLLAGSGITARNVRKYLELADGVIVGTSLKNSGNVSAPVDRERVRELVQAARKQ